MTLEILFITLNDYGIPIALVIFALPWLVWILCDLIPGQWEEPLLLSVNMGLAVLSLALWTGYLAFTSTTQGWLPVIQQANVLLLFAPLYYVCMSFWVARQRMPLSEIPAFRTIQGLGLMTMVFLVLSWLSRRVYIVFFSRVPFSYFLVILAGLLVVAYLGYRRVVGGSPRRPE